MLYGLVVQDLQIGAVLGETPVAAEAVAAHADRAVDAFLVLTAPRRRPA